METATVIDLAREAIWITLMVSAPLLSVALAVGVLVGILQAATSINEATLSFIPKLICMGIAIVVFGNWQISVLTDYIHRIFEKIPTLFS